jgi:hypothetical protein
MLVGKSRMEDFHPSTHAMGSVARRGETSTPG